MVRNLIEIKKLSNTISQINQQYEKLVSKSDEDLIERTKELKEFVINSRQERRFIASKYGSRRESERNP